MEKPRKNRFLRFREWLEHDLSNNVKDASGNDLFDWFSLVILFGIGSLFVVYLFFLGEIGLKETISGIILWFTAFAILRYTKETFWLKHVAQNELKMNRRRAQYEIAPLIRLRWLNRPGYYEIHAVNDGRGPARDLELKIINGNNGPQTKKIPVVSPGSESQVHLNIDKSKEYLIELKRRAVDNQLNSDNFRIIGGCFDAIEQEYELEYHANDAGNKDGFDIIKHRLKK